MTTLLIFIDGLSHSLANERLTILEGATVYPITPGVGFSNNLYPEMLSGQTPDEIGYFNEWSPAIDAPKALPAYLRLADAFRHNLYLNAGFRKIFLQRLMKRNFANIPFKSAHYFQQEGSHNFRDLKSGLLKDYDFDIFDAVEMKARVGLRDGLAIEAAESKMRNANTLVSLVDLDNIAHINGLHSTRFSDHISLLNGRINALIARFLTANPDGRVFIFSDHGMSDVTTAVNLDIEAVLGQMELGKYLYFLDSTFLRIWTKNPSIESAATEFLRKFEYGDIVSQDERIEYGISNPQFGDIIYRAKEGVLFLPNFYGARHVKAMHGYDSRLASQTAFIASMRGEASTSHTPCRSRDVYSYLKQQLADPN